MGRRRAALGTGRTRQERPHPARPGHRSGQRHRLAAEAGVAVTFIQDDLTDLRHVSGTFDLLVDYGTLDDLSLKDRELYRQNMLPLTRPGSRFLLYCFEWSLRWWERLIPRFPGAFEPGEVQRH
jgi:hypothetical protein